MKVLMITECQYHEVPDDDQVRFIYRELGTKDFFISDGQTTPFNWSTKECVFKPIVIGQMVNGSLVEERICIVNGDEVSEKLVNIFELVRKDADSWRALCHTVETELGVARNECKAWEKVHGEWMKEKYEFIHMSLWKRLKFLFGVL